jgi:prepilin-type processing-associated H-X9-DG protein
MGAHGTPFQRFYGGQSSPISIPFDSYLFKFFGGTPRYYIPRYRHGGSMDLDATDGQFHLAMLDGHVGRFNVLQLVDLDQQQSNYTILWSPIDHQLDDPNP